MRCTRGHSNSDSLQESVQRARNPLRQKYTPNNCASEPVGVIGRDSACHEVADEIDTRYQAYKLILHEHNVTTTTVDRTVCGGWQPVRAHQTRASGCADWSAQRASGPPIIYMHYTCSAMPSRKTPRLLYIRLSRGGRCGWYGRVAPPSVPGQKPQ